MADSLAGGLSANEALLHLPVRFLTGAQLGRYLLVSTLTALSWDLLTHLEDELTLLRGELSLSVSLYFVSRLCTLADVLAAVIYTTSTQVSCKAASRINTVFFVLGQIATLSLFFLRVRAVFLDKPWTIRFFLFLSLCTAGICAAVPFLVNAHELPIDAIEDGPPGACFQTTFRPICAACLISSFVNDTAIFFAVSLKLAKLFGESLHDRLKYVVGRTKHPRPSIARTLLQGGQQYFLVSITASVAMIIMTFMSSVHPVMKSNLAAPYATLVNIMACKVYRDLKLWHFRSDLELKETSEISFMKDLLVVEKKQRKRNSNILSVSIKVTTEIDTDSGVLEKGAGKDTSYYGYDCNSLTTPTLD